MIFYNNLINWYLQNKRDLPWRQTKDPYKIWLSEIILQQTKVAQGMPYYLNFINKYPTVFHLAKAKEQDILKLWQGLGYYSRARNLHFSAKYIVANLKGKFPTTYNEIIKLKGVGDYTASAIASICFNEPTAVVDGNVYRVLARFFQIKTPINSTKGIKEFKETAQELISIKQPGNYNQAIMDLGATICTPKKAYCNQCPVNYGCLSFKNKTILQFPVKEKKVKISKKYFNYLVINTPNKSTFLEKREKGIWKNMYQFPLIETEKTASLKTIITHKTFKKLTKNIESTVTSYHTKQIVHKLSHLHLYTKFWIVEANQTPLFSFSWQEIEQYPVPKLIDNFIKQFKNT